MSQTLERIRPLVAAGDYLVSTHAAEQLDHRGLLVSEVLSGVDQAIVVEDYPNFPKGPCVLVLQQDAAGNPIHALWGLRTGTIRPAVLITSYRPDVAEWTADFLHRRSS